jgi:NADPH:quinone reductase-like Zn-dependent oxidoreductase
MKTWEIQDFGLENVKQTTREIPTPGPKEILVKVAAVSLNFRDKAIIDGIYFPHLMKMPIVPASDFAGTVAGVGSEVTKFKEGDRVTSLLFPNWKSGLQHPADVSDYALGGPVDGGLSEYAILTEEGAIKTPAGLTDAEASTLPIAALTAWTALVELGQLKKGQTVVTLGTGGVSLFAVQLASSMGARVIALSSSPEKLELLKKLGATDTVDYKANPNWQESVLELTGGAGVDNVIDIVGGTSLNKSLQAIRNGGQVSVIGFLEDISASVEILTVVFKAARIQGTLVGSAEAMARLVDYVAANNIKPVIEKTYAFDDAIEAYNHLAKGAVGKIVINVG